MKNVEINDNSLLKFPFTFNLDIPLPLEDLFHQSKHFTKEIEHLNYKIKFIKKSEKKTDIHFYNTNNEFIYYLEDILYNPIIIDIVYLFLSQKQLKIFSYEQMKNIIYKFNKYYQFLDKENKLIDNINNIEEFNYIKIKKKFYKINENFL